MRITLFAAFPDAYRQSMRVYTDELTAALRLRLSPHETVTSFLPTGVRTAPAVARYWSQYVTYPCQARRVQGTVNHIVDHAYGHLVHALDPRRTVVTFHDAVALKARRHPWVDRLNLAGLRRAAAIICVSEATRQALVAHCPASRARVAVIPEGVRERFFGSGDGDPRHRLNVPAGRYLLHVGHTRPYKNVPALLRVVAHLVRMMGPEIRLLKVGTAFTTDQEQLIDQLGLRRQIVHLGRISDDLLPTAYRCAEALLVPSWDEGFGLPVLEAMASGVPVVVSNRGALPETVGSAGLVVDPDDPQRMAEAVAGLLQDPPRRAALIAAGVARARDFTWQRTAEQTLAVYRTVAGFL